MAFHRLMPLHLEKVSVDELVWLARWDGSAGRHCCHGAFQNDILIGMTPFADQVSGLTPS